mmetsp:Transcript_114923/g.245359  ORF Transcript_114923/g.245359 Transcript_114923/m.245359 type:complete len:173 (+) Transcript_114923:154-672(+)
MKQSQSVPGIQRDESTEMGELGELHIRRMMGKAKDKMRGHKNKLEDSMRASRELFLAGESAAGTNWLGADEGRRKSKAVFDGQPKYVGQQANELSKWMNAESITRHKEEMTLGVPTLRQILKVDDDIGMKQMTKSQLCALPSDPTVGNHGPKWDPKANHRHMSSYRPVMRMS